MNRCVLMGWIGVLTFFVVSADAAQVNKPDKADKAEAVERGVDFRKQIVQFETTFRQKNWAQEDQWILAERGFQDEIRKQVRDLQIAVTSQIEASEDWTKASNDAKQKRRTLETELRQRLRVHSEQFQLELLRFHQKRDEELKQFQEKLKKDLAQFHKKPGFDKAEKDIQGAWKEVVEAYKAWHSKVKGLATKSF